MSKINPLSDSLINQIAAGEVVERPSSVVKELIENSLDAGATQIDIEIRDGGKKSILVRDNGQGIAPDEMMLALSRHATSKINSLEDLTHIQSLGFRGEALASIASVSKLTLTSKQKNNQTPAREVQIEGGKVISDKEAGHPEGTSVLVKYLFYQTPARLKFLKSTETELSHLVDHFIRAALVHPTVAMRLSHQGKTLYNLLPADTLSKRITDLFGKEISDACYEIGSGQGGLEISGFIGHPNMSRSHNRHMYLFVNERPVRDKVLFHAVLEGYRDLLMRGRYPFIALYLKVPFEMVDVNVHPSKVEVRFSNSSVIHQKVYETIRQRLQTQPWKKSDDNQLWHQCRKELSDNLVAASTITLEDSAKKVEMGHSIFSELEVLGQCMATFILCQTGETLVLVDQHAAHERIGFEKLLTQYQEESIPSEYLLIPENFDLNPSETEVLKKYLKDLLAFGLEIEFFGGNTFVVKAIPSLLKDRIAIRDLILDLIGDALEKGRLSSLKDQFHSVLARMACHGAIRANHALTREEMKSLLKELEKVRFSSFCPHGRPVSVEVTRNEIDRWFKRVL